jgi:hypothetical protein
VADDRRQRWQAALLIAALLLFNAPLLVVVDRLALPGGPLQVPLTPLFLFLAWLAVIGLCCALNARRPRPPRA